MKSKFVNHVIITYWLKKRNKKIHGFEMYCYAVNLKKLSSNTIFRWYTFGNSALSNSIILVKDLTRWKRGFEILIDHYTGDIGNKNITGKY